MTGTSKAAARHEAFLAPRRARPDGAAGLAAAPTLAEHRREQLGRFRGLQAAGDAAALAPELPPDPNWTPIGPIAVLDGQAGGQPTVSGRVPSLAVSSDGRRVYVASANGGVWRSLDAGTTWTAMSDEFDEDPQARKVDSLACGAIALVEGDAADTDRLYVGTGEGFTSGSSYGGVGPLVSPDGGRTWAQEDVQTVGGGPHSLEGEGFFALAVDPRDADHVLAATGDGLYRRIPDGSGGFVWRRQLTTESSSVVVSVSGNTTRFVALLTGGLVRASTTTGGVHGAWSDPAAPGGTLPTANIGRGTLAAAPSDPDVLYAMLAQATPSVLDGVYRVDLSEGIWRPVTGVPADVLGTGDGGQGFYDQALVVDPGDPDRFYIGGKGTGAGAAIHRCDVTTSGTGPTTTHTAASTSIGASAHADVHALVFRPGSSRELWVGCDGGVFVAQDATASGSDVFAPRNTGLATLSLMGLAHHPHDPTFVFCGVQDNGGVRYRGNEVWEHRLAGDGGATVFDWAVPAPGTVPPVGQRPLRLLNGYIRGSVRRITADAARYADEDKNVPLSTHAPPPTPPPAERVLFYPPIEGVRPDGDPAHSGRVAFGSERPWVSDDFGDTWRSVPNNTLAGDALVQGGFPQRIQSLCWATYRLLYLGSERGHVYRIRETGAGWQPVEHLGRPAGGLPVTSITLDPRDGDGDAVWITLGGHGTGDHVWRYDHKQAPGSRFTAHSTNLLDTQHNALAVDPDHAEHLYVGADIGVWRSTDAGATWGPFSPGLPDSAVLDLELHPGVPESEIVDPGRHEKTRLLRAATHGRGVWEIALDRAEHPGVELYLRANRADDGRGAAPTGGFHVTEPDVTLATDQSPDILVDAPDEQGRYRVAGRVDDPAVFLDVRDRDGRLLTAPEDVEAVTHVLVQVHGLGVTPATEVQVTLLVAAATADGPDLPAGYDALVRAGDPIDADGWRTVGVRTTDGVRAGQPRVVRFDLSSRLLATFGDLEDDPRIHLLALVHHVDDAYEAAGRDPGQLSREHRLAALRTAATQPASGRAVQPAPGGSTADTGAAIPAVAPDGGPLGVSQLPPMTVAVLARRRLADAADGLARKIGSGRVQAGFGGFTRTVTPSDTERRVHALAAAARDSLEGGPAVPVAPDHPAAGLGRYALLGAVGFELPAYAGMLTPGGAWVADTLRRGSPDPNRSLVSVPAAELALSAGRLALEAAKTDEERARARAFTGGLLAATAAGVLVSPQLRDLLGRETHRDWERWLPSAGARAVDAAVRERLLRGGPLPEWWPAAADVPDAIWTGLLEGIEQTYLLPTQRRPGFAAFESALDTGRWLTSVRLRNAYAAFHESWGSSTWHWTAYWGLLAPVLLGPPMAMLTGRALPNASAFFDPDRSVDERAVFELLTTAYAWGSVPPFVYSMILWGVVDEPTEPFVNALVLFLARAGLSAAGFVTADDPGASDLARWLGIATPLLLSDAYATARAAVGAGTNRPGEAAVFGMQTIPALTGLATLGVSGIVKAAGIEDGAPFWVTWGVFTAAMLAAGIPVAVALADGGGWQSWFLRPDRRFPVLDSLDRARKDAVDPRALAHVFDDSTLWPDAGSGLHEHSLPSGSRVIVRLWWTGTGALEISHDARRIVLRSSDAGEQTVEIPPSGVSADTLATLLEAALGGIEAEPVEATDPQYTLPWPQTVADPGDEGPAADHPLARTQFQAVGTDRDGAYVLRHAPRFDTATPASLHGVARSATEAYPVVPGASLGDLEQTGLGLAGDLAALLAMGAAPTLNGGTIQVDGIAAPDNSVAEVYQVFRRWNLDERRLNEWRMLVSGGADTEGTAPDDPLVRATPAGYGTPHPEGARLAAAMGWIPLWRAWLRVATDSGSDSEADVALASTPVITFPDGTRRRPTNRELSDGVRFLFDLR